MQRFVRPLGAVALIAFARVAHAQGVAPANPAVASDASATGFDAAVASSTATTDASMSAPDAAVSAESDATVVTEPPPPDPPRPVNPVPCDQTGSDALMAAARVHFAAGQTFVESGAWSDAARELRTALAYFDSPNSHYLLGAALVGLQRFDEAYNEFDGTIEQAARCAQADQTRGRSPRYQETVAGALRDRDALTPRVALLGVRVPDDAPASLTLVVNGLALPRRFWNRLRAYPPGDARAVGEAVGYARFVGTTPLDPRRAQWLDVAMVRVASTADRPSDEGPRRWLRPLGITAAAVGGAALIAGAVTFFVGRGAFDALREECGGACPPSGDYPSRIDRGESVETAGIGIFWSGVVVAAAGVTLAILGGRAPATAEGPAATSVSARPRARLGGAGLEVTF